MSSLNAGVFFGFVAACLAALGSAASAQAIYRRAHTQNDDAKLLRQLTWVLSNTFAAFSRKGNSEQYEASGASLTFYAGIALVIAAVCLLVDGCSP